MPATLALSHFGMSIPGSRQESGATDLRARHTPAGQSIRWHPPGATGAATARPTRPPCCPLTIDTLWYGLSAGAEGWAPLAGAARLSWLAGVPSTDSAACSVVQVKYINKGGFGCVCLVSGRQLGLAHACRPGRLRLSRAPHRSGHSAPTPGARVQAHDRQTGSDVALKFIERGAKARGETPPALPAPARRARGRAGGQAGRCRILRWR